MRRLSSGNRNKHIPVMIAAAVILLTAAVFLWAGGAFLPRWIRWNTKTEQADLNGNGAPATLELSGKRLTVSDADEGIVSTSQAWKVSDFLLSDIDGDGNTEILLLCWKRGSFTGPKPFWIEKDEPWFSQHIYVFRYEGDRLKPVWMSSKLGITVADWALEGAQEGSAQGTARCDTLRITQTDGEETLWKWEYFGFKLEEGSAGSGEAGQSGPEADSGKTEDPALGAASGKTADPGVRTLSLIAVGDNIAHESVYESSYIKGTGQYDFNPIYADVKEKISSYDLAAVNQETILVHEPGRRSGFPVFGTPEQMGDALWNTGFDIVTCATNHANDKGTDGLTDTLSFWETKHPEVTVLGIHESAEEADRITYLTRNGIRLALFNYTYGLNGRALPEGEEWRVDQLGISGERLTGQLREAENEADVSVCFLHVGTEYSTEPDEKTKDLCEDLIDAGADLIICTHPHILQELAFVSTGKGNTGYVYYSLGNFMSYQTIEGTQEGGAAEVIFTKQDGKTSMDCRLLRTQCHLEQGRTRVTIEEAEQADAGLLGE